MSTNHMHTAESGAALPCDRSSASAAQVVPGLNIRKFTGLLMMWSQIDIPFCTVPVPFGHKPSPLSFPWDVSTVGMCLSFVCTFPGVET